MKTLQIGMGWFPEQAGGLNRVFYDCIRHLPEAGVEIQGLVAGSSNVASDSRSQVQAFAPTQSPLWQRWRGVQQSVRQLLAEENYPLIVSHFAVYTLPILDRLIQRPMVMHFHGPWALESSVAGNKNITTRLKKLLEQAVYQRATDFIVLSKAFRDILHQEYGAPFERIHIVPGGVDTERFETILSRTEARAILDWPQDRPIIFAVRRLARRMGLENLISAVEKVRTHHPEVLLLIAGKGSLRSTLQAQIDELGLGDHVRLLGYIPDQNLVQAYRAANFSVVPTVALEGFGLIVIESLAAGTPVLGTPIGGIPEILRPFSKDLVFEGVSTEQLAQGIEEVLSGHRQLPSSQACKAYVQEHYAWPVIAQQIKTVYQTALDGKIR
ncbi:MAG: glycosyltransferase family 4 protein [Leptolyngbyaceae cyanobacterium MO_188.B28]|nr:glycosyltransferase family 4 protein [Leptolyngbyaceae cyanobacterium MO_188.B28]